MWLLDYISTHGRTGAHSHMPAYTHKRTITNAHTQSPGLITYIEDRWLLFGLFDYGV